MPAAAEAKLDGSGVGIVAESVRQRENHKSTDDLSKQSNPSRCSYRGEVSFSGCRVFVDSSEAADGWSMVETRRRFGDL